MLSLYDLQRSFQDMILGKTEINPKSHFQIYQNNRMISLMDRLKNVYSTIQKIVGEDFFVGAANQYIMQYPSSSRNLRAFGSYFSDFLSTFPPVEKLPYLPDVARFEWACHEVFYAQNGSLFDFAELQSVPPEKYGDIKFQLHPAVRLCEFQHPVLDIFRMCQFENNHNDIVDYNAGGEKILVTRCQLDVDFERLSTGAFSLLSAFCKGLIFERACSVALHADPDFNIESCLQEHVLLGTITEFYL